ncbi:MAG: carboxy-S-adenosyl-L-methionine synthase CmoA [Oscillatoriales cyanobacterium RM1_1_9]|nr:carboxy-S-adenosyl-L-methionine synthase CmoA [Oscillatoriales cyanobacterium SM2_3_0]NJO47714.1 carboxy-S-adenosyl-L-methionine synthase CmoA [Oscillatoriales cyanobacterium RM2_1_1]NJO72089.1 carboxy-S-adenosyl-L-methionine synthase CmoA [Oscillatoriales cyanobacterium RM1_1_9]
MNHPFNPQLYFSSEPDRLFDQEPWPKPFSFNHEVAQVFDNMVSRSVPLYRELITCAVQWTLAYYRPGTCVVDVGCSTGTFLELLGRFLQSPGTLVGLDNSAAMLEKAREKLKHLETIHRVELICDQAENYTFDQTSVVVMNYTLQFLPLAHRQKLLEKIYQGLTPGGLLFLSEKVRSPIPQFQETMTQHYEALKTHNGYAQTEIERKKEALENVLIPLTEPEQLQMLKTAGFQGIDSLLKLHNFVSFVALKTN